MKRVDFLLHTPIAHRGLHSKSVPENSLEAFRRAAASKFPIELDVHLIKSGEVVVFHDNNLKRMCGIDKEISKCTFTEIRELYLNHTHERIPLLSEVLAIINGKVPLLIELKCDQPAGKLEKEVLEVLEDYKGKIALQSFNPLSLRWLKKHAPDIARGQLASDFKGNKNVSRLAKPILKNLWHFSFTKPDFIAYDIRALPNKRIEKLHKTSLPVIGWTATKIPETTEALKYCDNLVCEDIL